MAKAAKKAVEEEVVEPEAEAPEEEAVESDPEQLFTDADHVKSKEFFAEDDLQDLEDVLDEEEEPAPKEAPAEAETQETGEKAKEEVPQEVQATPAEPEPEPTPEPTPEVQPEPVTEPVTEQEPVPQISPEEYRKQYEEWRTGAIKQLETYFTPDEETVAQFEENPGQMLAHFAARVYLDSVQMSQQAIMQQLPQAVNVAHQARQSNEVAEKQFAEKWPQLDLTNGEHMKTIIALASSYRQANPQAQLADTITHVGAQAMVALKVPQGTVVEEAPEDPPAKPFKPAGQSAPRAAKPSRSDNPITDFDQAAFEDTDDLDLD